MIQLSSEIELWKESAKYVSVQSPTSAGGASVGHTALQTSGGWSQLSPSQFAMPLPDCTL